MESKEVINPAVLMIDMQQRYLKSISPIEKEILIPSQIKVLGYCSQNDVPAVGIQMQSPIEPTIDELLQELIKVPRHKIIEKNTSNGFQGTDLAESLETWDINYVYLMGVYVFGCVESTAVGALDKGYQIGTSRDLITGPGNKIPTPKSQITESKNLSVKFYESLSWYVEKGDVFDDHKSLIDHMDACLRKNKQQFSETQN